MSRDCDNGFDLLIGAILRKFLGTIAKKEVPVSFASQFPDLGEEVLIADTIKDKFCLRRVRGALRGYGADHHHVPAVGALQLNHIIGRENRDGVGTRWKIAVLHGEGKGHRYCRKWPFLGLDTNGSSNRQQGDVEQCANVFHGNFSFLSAGESG